jgi:hypothetical protein
MVVSHGLLVLVNEVRYGLASRRMTVGVQARGSAALPDLGCPRRLTVLGHLCRVTVCEHPTMMVVAIQLMVMQVASFEQIGHMGSARAGRWPK